MLFTFYFSLWKNKRCPYKIYTNNFSFIEVLSLSVFGPFFNFNICLSWLTWIDHSFFHDIWKFGISKIRNSFQDQVRSQLNCISRDFSWLEGHTIQSSSLQELRILYRKQQKFWSCFNNHIWLCWIHRTHQKRVLRSVLW